MLRDANHEQRTINWLSTSKLRMKAKRPLPLRLGLIVLNTKENVNPTITGAGCLVVRARHFSYFAM